MVYQVSTETYKQYKWSNYLTFPVVDHGFLDENVIFSEKENMV